jgi:hypothetical protein
MSTPRDVIGASLRYRVEPRDVPPSKAARRLGLTLAEFDRLKDDLIARGFPRPDPTTGHYDLKAIEAWQDVRSGITPPGAVVGEPVALNAEDVFRDRIARLTDGQR